MSKKGFKREMIAAESYLKDLDYLHIKNNAQLKLVGVVNCLFKALKELEEEL